MKYNRRLRVVESETIHIRYEAVLPIKCVGSSKISFEAWQDSISIFRVENARSIRKSDIIYLKQKLKPARKLEFKYSTAIAARHYLFNCRSYSHSNMGIAKCSKFAGISFFFFVSKSIVFCVMCCICMKHALGFWAYSLFSHVMDFV